MMTGTRSSSPVRLLIVATAALASCSPEQERSADPAANETQRAEAPVEPWADTLPASVSDRAPEIAPLTAEGWGPLRIGMTLAEVTAAVGADSDPGALGGPEPEVCDIFHPKRAPEGLRVMIEGNRLARISISSPAKVKTDHGLGPGDSDAAVKAAYGDELVASGHEYEGPPAEYLTVWAVGDRDEPYVRSRDARGIRYEVGRGGTVDIIHAGGPAIQYVEGCL